MNFPAKKPKVISIRVSVELFERIQNVAKYHDWSVAHAASYLIQQGFYLLSKELS